MLALWSEDPKGKTSFDANKDYTILDISYSTELVSELGDAFPEFSAVLHSGKATVLSRKPSWLHFPMRDSIKQMLGCPHDQATRSFFLDLKVREYLFLALTRKATLAIESQSLYINTLHLERPLHPEYC